jgi:hypothetical protein
MGGLGRTLKLQRTRADAMAPEAFHRELWGKIDDTVRATVTGKAGEQVLTYYWGATASDGFDDGNWASSAEALYFSFSDSAGFCVMSHHAAIHWLDMVLWTDPAVRGFIDEAGWALVDVPYVPAFKKMAEVHTTTLLELRDVLYRVARRSAGQRVDDDDFSPDQGVPRVFLADLTPPERVLLEAAAYSGACNCEYCCRVLPTATLQEWESGHLEHVGPSWEALDTLEAEVASAQAACLPFEQKQWLDEPLGPPELQALREALARRGLAPPIPRLVAMIMRR